MHPSVVASMNATPSVVSDLAWYPDSGVTTQLTNDIAKLTECRVYNGLGKLVVGNGHSITISHIGKTILSDGSHSLPLKDLLYVPNIRKKKISISNFVRTIICILSFISLLAL